MEHAEVNEWYAVLEKDLVGSVYHEIWCRLYGVMSKELIMPSGFSLSTQQYCVALVFGRRRGRWYRLCGVMQSLLSRKPVEFIEYDMVFFIFDASVFCWHCKSIIDIGRVEQIFSFTATRSNYKRSSRSDIGWRCVVPTSNSNAYNCFVEGCSTWAIVMPFVFNALLSNMRGFGAARRWPVCCGSISRADLGKIVSK